MKKFSFTLQSVYNYKLTVEKSQKADLKNAQARLRELREQEKRLDEAFEKTAQSLDRVLREKLDIAEELPRHDVYFRYLRDARAELMVKIEEAERHKNKCQELLIGTMKEIKTYKKLKEEQFQRYLEEMRREEAKDIGDLVSFQTISGGR